MTIMMKQRFQALLYIGAILAALQITGCRSNSFTEENPLGGGILPPSSVSAQITTAGEAGSTSLASDTPVVHVTWSNPVYTAAEYTIQLEYKKASESTFTAVEMDTATSHIISGIDETQSYNIRLKATTENGEMSEYAIATASVDSEGGGGDPGTATCPVAQMLIASVINPTTVQLSWGWSSGNYSNMDAYQVQRKLFSSSAWSTVHNVIVNGVPAVSYTDAAAPTGEIHYRIVSDCDGNAQNSSASNAVTAMTALPVPVITAVSFYTLNRHNIVIQAYSAPSGSGHNGFQVQAVTTTGVTKYQTYTVPSQNQFNNLTLENSECPVGAQVTYRIRATRSNLLYSSDWSGPWQVNCP